MGVDCSFRELVWPEVEDLVVGRVEIDGEAVRVEARSERGTVVCPDCTSVGTRVHSTYRRRLADRPLGGRRVVLILLVRRFFCGNGACSRRTFVEQVGCLSRRYARRTQAVARILQAIGLAVGGRAGARLAPRLGLRTTRAAILRQLRLLPDPPVGTVRVLGVDEFAFRKGRTYGTVLVDVETGRPVDLLPDRAADTLAAWLTKHPGVEIVCRDRYSAFSEATKRAAPDAIQVADRWHLLHSLARAVERTAHAHRPCLRKDADATSPDALLELIQPLPPASDPPDSQILARVRLRHQDIHDRPLRGDNLSAISRDLRLDRKTVRRYANIDLDDLLASARDRRPEILARFKPYIQQRFRTGGTNAAQLFREVREQGYPGSKISVRRYVATLREGTAVEEPRLIPSPRQITSWIMRRPEALASGERTQLDRVLDACPDLRTARELAHAFNAMARDRQGTELTQWMTRALADGPKPIQSFAAFLQHDWDAVVNGLTLPWSSGVVEGQVTRIKLIKRRSYGRASFSLLRTLVLAQPP
ncbi:ISL3 family transposase [Streptomyces sp. NPDC097619]|uniref:ISL3 family transposase n=1 Tax=Streptomyces sp. NPDC097619 TaxID=3157228 RepID=UPI00332BF39A